MKSWATLARVYHLKMEYELATGWDLHINTGRFIMFFVITNIYNTETK
jgi:hypothetical protein